MERATIVVTGLVQGVGFRPYVYALASALELRGFVQNRGAHVFVEVEGEPRVLHTFIERLTATVPANAFIDRFVCHRAPPMHYQGFAIAASEAGRDAEVRIPPDVATCDLCVSELFDPANRRYRHPFITCTTCGPRYSILATMPYDRANTTMARFAMCDQCRGEYRNPHDRRFHAQAIACPECGPLLSACHGGRTRATGDAALRLAATVLMAGGVVAVKGLGGFHLACDATNERAVAALRERKRREQKPLAVMYDRVMCRRIAVGAGAHALAALASFEHPVVLLPAENAGASEWTVAPNVAPRSTTLGVLLPSTPLHHLLLHDVARPLVMTSGNLSDEPMVIDDDLALQTLGDVADLVVTHNRRIQARVDDSVVRVSKDTISVVRAARGHTPASHRLAERSPLDILALGGHLKNSFCVVKRDTAYVSPHIGTLDSALTYRSLNQTIANLTALLGIEPTVVAHDLHPDYLTTRIANELPAERRIPVQHHHAHVLSCVAEHHCTDPVIGVAFDGAGLGTDGAIWGGEFLIVEGTQCNRVAHLAYVPLPGGDAASREPWRMAVAHWHTAFDGNVDPIADALAAYVSTSRLQLLMRMIQGAIPCVLTSSVGRLFDAVAAILGIRGVAAYEGQAAMELEACASPTTSLHYDFDVDTSSLPWQIYAAPVIRGIASDVAKRRDHSAISGAFHQAVGNMIGTVVGRVAAHTGIHRVALTGGVFQNATLASLTARTLCAAGLDVIQHRTIPCNDGGLALGQALYAVRAIRAEAAREGQGVSVCA